MDPFRIDVPEAELVELRERLARTRPRVEGELAELLERWREFDWRAAEARLNAFPQFVERGLHFVHLRRGGAPLLLLHGWPSTFCEFLRVAPLLGELDLVIPSLPGFAFSASAPANRWAALFVELMDSLGYSRFAVHGGDIGAMVANRIALEAPERVTALHVTFLVEPAVAAPSEAEQAFLAERRRGQEEGGAYAHVQRTRPQTLAVAFADSPAGLAAWISERWREWSVRPIDAEELLTALTLYWVTGTIGTSFRPYADWALGSASLGLAWEGVAPGVDSRPLPPGARIEVPTAITLFGARWPRSWAERGYADIRRWREVDGVGHFPGLEAPDVLADELRASVV